ncbi:MAG: ABC transporter ATP-binding protein [Lacunisphaera sp.]
MNIIETRHLAQCYWTKASLYNLWSPGPNPPAGWKTKVLFDITLSVPEGSIYALVGTNGAGKTTTLKVLMNLLRPDGGVAQVFGVDTVSLGEKEFAQIGYISESQHLPKWMTVQQFLDYCRPFYPTWDRALEAKLLSRFDLPLDRRLEELSRGTLMKASLLSSLAYRPKLLVLDEPFGGLDPVARDDVTQGLLESVQQGETTVLISSHDIEEVERLADNVALIEDGRVKFAQPTEALLGRFRRIEVAQEEMWLANSHPPGWINWESGAGRTSFIDSAYNREASEALCQKHFPFAPVQVQPLSLREIFIVTARKSNRSLQRQIT